MYGKVYPQLFTGSMYGAGSHIFAVMSYVIAYMKPDPTMGYQVELNAKDLAARIGDTVERMQAAIEFLCSPDEESRTPTDDGRRLVKIGAYDYRVVNGRHYNEVKNLDHLRELNRNRQARHRQKKQGRKPESSGASRAAGASREERYVKADGDGDFKKADETAAENLPGGKPPVEPENDEPPGLA